MTWSRRLPALQVLQRLRPANARLQGQLLRAFSAASLQAPLAESCDHVLHKAATGSPRVPGVVAVVTDRHRNIYEGCAGQRSLGADGDMTLDTVMRIYSCTKALAATCALQLVEEGRLDLDAPARKYAPHLGKVQVLEGFDAKGNPKLRPPVRDVTTRHLLTHTAGFAYETFNEAYLQLILEHGQLSMKDLPKAALPTFPLVRDPGEKWEYGVSLDWVGEVVEGITDKRLDEVMQERVLGPLGMDSTGYDVAPAWKPRLAAVHQRDESLGLTPIEITQCDAPMGGSGVYSTAPDYAKFIRMWLNDGAGDDGKRVLREETVQMGLQNNLGRLKVSMPMPGLIPPISPDVDFFPGVPKSWSLCFMINDETAPTGRPAGAHGWAGIANLYYWIDVKNGIGGFWGTQIFPFEDPTSTGGYLEFETAVYDILKK